MNLITKKENPSNNPFKHIYSYQAILPLNPTKRPVKDKSEKQDKANHKNYGKGNNKNNSQLKKANKQAISQCNYNKVNKCVETKKVYTHLSSLYYSEFINHLKELLGNNVLDYLEKNKIAKWIIDKLEYIISTKDIRDIKNIYLYSLECIDRMLKSSEYEYSEDNDLTVL